MAYGSFSSLTQADLAERQQEHDGEREYERYA